MNVYQRLFSKDFTAPTPKYAVDDNVKYFRNGQNLFAGTIQQVRPPAFTWFASIGERLKTIAIQYDIEERYERTNMNPDKWMQVDTDYSFHVFTMNEGDIYEKVKV